MKVVVTGASGFVGRELVTMLAERTDWDIVAASREHDRAWPQRVQVRDMPNLADAEQTRPLDALVDSAQAVIHLAALTPGRNNASDILAFRAANSEGTDRIVRACMANGVKKFIMMSSSRVSGATTGSTPIDETSPANPDDAYACSKLMAEKALRAATADGLMSWTIIRAPLIYGPGAKGQLLNLTRAISRGMPLPLGSIRSNRRDMVGVRNVCRFIELCLANPRAENGLFVVRDGQSVSTRGLVEGIARAMDRRANLLPVPVALLEFVGMLTGRGHVVDRLVGNHQVDDSKARQLLGWTAEAPIDFDLKRMVRSLSV